MRLNLTLPGGNTSAARGLAIAASEYRYGLANGRTSSAAIAFGVTRATRPSVYMALSELANIIAGSVAWNITAAAVTGASSAVQSQVRAKF